MYILGLNGSPNLVHENQFGIEESIYHDSAAALLHNGHIIAAIEEERLNRIKHSNKLPVLALKACLKQHSLTADDIDCFAFGTSRQSLDHMLARHFSARGQEPPGAHAFIQRLLEEQLAQKIPADKIELFEHHYVHAVTAFYPSGFRNALVLTIDGSGGEYSGSVYDGNNNTLTSLYNFSIEQSLGHFYLYVTFLLGFHLFDEYKVMGLAPYGNPATYRSLFEGFYKLLPDGNYELYTKQAAVLQQLIPSINNGFTQIHMDVAAALQECLEIIVFHVVKHYKEVTGRTKLCMAGGVALNCTLNGKLMKSGLFKDVFIYPGASDSGIPVGSALAAYFKRCEAPRPARANNLYLGREIGAQSEIGTELEPWNELISFEHIEDITAAAARLLASDKVIGWIQGRSEFAPRALGNRSILADPRPAKNKDRINAMVKKREGFRPFAPSVLKEFAATYFELPAGKTNFPYMTFILDVKKEYWQHLGAITHVDGTARVQTVSREENQRYWELINRFRELTGCAMLLNTSFNNNAEPIVDTVHDAVVCYLTTQLDYLIIGNYLIQKKDVLPDAIIALYPSLPVFLKIRKKEKQDAHAAAAGKYPYELANTFNERTVDISERMREIMMQFDGGKPLSAIFSDAGVNDDDEKDRLLTQLMNLWTKRVVILSPVPSGKQILIPS